MAVDVLVGIATDLWTSFAIFIPNLAGAVVLLALGYIIGRALGRVTYELLTRAGVDKELRKEAHIKVSVSHFLDMIVRWVVYLVFIQASADVLGIAALAAFVGTVVGFLPDMIAAGIVMLVAYAVGIYFKEELISSRTVYSKLTGKIIFFLVMYLGLSVALRVIGIPLLIVDEILLILVAAVGLGVAIALGLGLKDVVADLAKSYEDEYKGRRRR
ncbi:MAG: hypothetical protein HYS81_05200 [Candidatus Aenigmatarchaeota archaeon]|nr:MAG: hypothetical protein HYS81_05200 [Candidatus Aenigmarchaeota archaeon]